MIYKRTTVDFLKYSTMIEIKEELFIKIAGREFIFRTMINNVSQQFIADKVMGVPEVKRIITERIL